MITVVKNGIPEKVSGDAALELKMQSAKERGNTAQIRQIERVRAVRSWLIEHHYLNVMSAISRLNGRQLNSLSEYNQNASELDDPRVFDRIFLDWINDSKILVFSDRGLLPFEKRRILCFFTSRWGQLSKHFYTIQAAELFRSIGLRRTECGKSLNWPPTLMVKIFEAVGI